MFERCALVLKDGTVFYGKQFGAPAPLPIDLKTGEVRSKSVGEVVFNTGMSGYCEILTDPSYTGQIVTMTYPHIGNYGIDEGWNESGPEEGLRRPMVKAAGFVVRSLYTGPVPQGRKTLDAFLKENGTPGITDVDTRALTLHLRDNGSPAGVIVSLESELELSDVGQKLVVKYLESIPSMEGSNLIGDVGSDVSINVNEGEFPFALIDCGIKANIIREMENRGVAIKLFPSTVKAGEVLNSGVKGVLFSNGPGDPAVLEDQIELARSLVKKIPVFGICLGHQIISLALGAKTFKMKFGHHGMNNPVRDEFTKKVFVTSQNHGFAVDENLPKDVDVWFRNANDATIEGIAHKKLPVKSAQFHPEAAPGPHDSSWIFDEFIKTAKSANT